MRSRSENRFAQPERKRFRIFQNKISTELIASQLLWQPKRSKLNKGRPKQKNSFLRPYKQLNSGNLLQTNTFSHFQTRNGRAKCRAEKRLQKTSSTEQLKEIDSKEGFKLQSQQADSFFSMKDFKIAKR